MWVEFREHEGYYKVTELMVGDGGMVDAKCVVLHEAVDSANVIGKSIAARLIQRYDDVRTWMDVDTSWVNSKSDGGGGGGGTDTDSKGLKRCKLQAETENEAKVLLSGPWRVVHFKKELDDLLNEEKNHEPDGEPDQLTKRAGKALAEMAFTLRAQVSELLSLTLTLSVLTCLLVSNRRRPTRPQSASWQRARLRSAERPTRLRLRSASSMTLRTYHGPENTFTSR